MSAAVTYRPSPLPYSPKAHHSHFSQLYANASPVLAISSLEHTVRSNRDSARTRIPLSWRAPALRRLNTLLTYAEAGLYSVIAPRYSLSANKIYV